MLTASTSDAYSLLFKLLARRRRRSARAAAELSAVRSPDAARSRRAAAVRPRRPRRRGRSTSPASSARSRRARARCWSSARTTRPARSCPRAELDRLAALCAPRGIAIIADEVFADYELEPGASRRGRPRRDAPRRAVVRARRAVEVGRAAAGEARMDRRRRAGRARRRRARAARARLRHLSRRCRRRCSAAAAALLDRGAVVRAQIAARVATNYRELMSLAVRSAVVPRACRATAGGMRCMQVPSFEPEEDLAVHAADERRRAGASRLLLRLSARVVPRRSACCRPRRRSATASRASCGTLAAASTASMSRSDRPAPGGPAHPAVLVSVRRELGHRRHRRCRAGHRVAGVCRPARRCSCCRSTRWRPASSRRIPRSARWRSIRSSSASPACRSSRRSAARRRCRPAIARRSTRVRAAPRIDHRAVRRLKHARCARAFERFLDAEWRRDTARARALRTFVSEQAWWIEDYSLFRALHAREHERPWTEWPAALQRREPAAIDRARRELADEVLFHQYLQWLAGTQWQQARAATRTASRCSAICRSWSTATAPTSGRASISSGSTSSVGAPPDAFSATGQDWGMPVYRLGRRSALEDFRWLRERARRSADLFDGYRVDHLVGFYRTYGRPQDGGEAFFTPAGRAVTAARSASALLDLFRGAGAEIIAEDLGTVPDFVRASLARLGVPGLPRVPLGAPLAHRRPAVPRSVGLSAAVGRRVRARTTPSRSIDLVGQRARRRAAARSARCRSIQRLAARRGSRARAVRRRRARRPARGAVRVGLRPAAAADSGRVRLARSHQRAGDRQRRQLDATACRGRSITLDRSPRGARAKRSAARLV